MVDYLSACMKFGIKTQHESQVTGSSRVEIFEADLVRPLVLCALVMNKA
jgi:hypothetical protein